jgi:16S rRNA (cytosine967-C5)-methyltransferase
MARKSTTNTHNARELAYRILLEFEKERSRLDDLETRFLPRADLSPQERRFLKQLLSGVIRHLLYLDWIIRQFYKGKFEKLLNKTKTILRLGFYELIFLENIPAHASVNRYVQMAKDKINLKQSQMVNAILRTYLRLEEPLRPEDTITDEAQLLSIKYSIPLWLIKRWLSLWDTEATAALCEAISANPQFDVRIHTGRISAQQFSNLLREHNIAFQKSAHSDQSLRIFDMQAFIAGGWLDKGYCSVQDESAQIAVDLLDVQEGDYVLDICSAPGGKFLQILEKDKKDLVAVAMDVDKRRLLRVRENLQRMALSQKSYLVVADGRQPPFKSCFHKILLDAPCSGLGTLSKHPDIKWRRSMDQLMEFSRLQADLLKQATRLLHADGRLVYSTCTIEPLENEQVIDAFLEKQNLSFGLENIPERYANLRQGSYLRTFPHLHETDGSFCASIKKKYE